MRTQTLNERIKKINEETQKKLRFSKQNKDDLKNIIRSNKISTSDKRKDILDIK